MLEQTDGRKKTTSHTERMGERKQGENSYSELLNELQMELYVALGSCYEACRRYMPTSSLPKSCTFLLQLEFETRSSA